MKRIVLLILILLSFGQNEICYGQWKQMFQFPSAVRTLYFLDQVGHPEIGFAGTFEVTSEDAQLWRTTDRGVTWIQLNIPPKSISIADIVFKDSLTGWFITKHLRAVELQGVHRTTDGGNTWTLGKAAHDLTVAALYYNQFTKRLFVSSWEQYSYSSVDDGDSWQDFAKYGLLTGYAFADGLRGIASSTQGVGFVMTTSDGGINWITTKERWGGWQPAAKKGTSTFFTFSEYKNELRRSDDNGATWNAVSTLSAPVGFEKKQFTGCLRLNGCSHLFTQSQKIGFFTSTDEGVHWQNIGGPSNTLDTRFCINGDDVFASDTNGTLWVFHDSLEASSSAASAHFSSSRIINDSLNVTLHLPIYFHHSGTMNDVDMILHYPTQSLKFLSTTLYNGKSFDVPGSSWDGRTALHFTGADLNAASDSLLGYVNFLWTPYELECFTILFDSINTHSTEAPCSGSNSANPFTGIIGSYKNCGLSGVADERTNTLPPDFSIHPNPAKNTVEVVFSGNDTKLQYQLFDALGISHKNGMTSDVSFKLDVSDLAEGNYYLRITNAGGMPVTKRVVIVK